MGLNYFEGNRLAESGYFLDSRYFIQYGSNHLNFPFVFLTGMEKIINDVK